jgi:membrane associated rhomboid family serine protease
VIPIRDNIHSKTFPFAALFLIIINTAVLFYQLTLTPGENHELIYTAGAVPERIFSTGANLSGLEPLLTLATSLFLHGGILHAGGNMLFLLTFGISVEDKMGHFSFLLFYLLCGVAATLTHAWYNSSSASPVIGASGAVSGVLGAYMLMFPKAKIKVLVFLLFFITTINVPALIFIGGWAALQFLNVSRGNPQIAWYAHIGGFTAGAAITGAVYLKRKLTR